MWVVSFFLDSAVFLPRSKGRLECIWKLKIFSPQRQAFSSLFTLNPCNLLYPCFKQILKRETNGLWSWKVSRFLIHCFRESLELPHKTCRLRKIGKNLFKDFSLCSLMFQDASCMTAHMSLSVHGALHVQKPRQVNSFCTNERAAVYWPRGPVSFPSWAAELCNSPKMYSPKISSRTFPNI